MKLSTTDKFRALHVITHLLAIYGIWYTITYDAKTWVLLSFLMFLFAGIVGVNIALHRYFSHRSFETSKFKHYFLLIASFFPMLGSPVAWGSVHIYHHIHSDKKNDPHSPKNAGKFGSWFTLWPEIKIPLSIFKFLAKDNGILWLHKNYFKIVIFYVLILTLIDPLLVVFLFAIPAVGCFHGASTIAVIPHLTNIGGYRNHNTNDNSYNNWIAWIFSLGEGWHNNHHNNSKNYRSGEKWWELDPSAFIIKHFFIK